MRFRIILASLAFAVFGIGAVAPQATEARAIGASLAVSGTVSGENGAGTFAGVATDLAFVAQGGQIVLSGELTGTITAEDGTETAVAQAFAAAVVVGAGAECGELVVDVAAIVVVESGAEIDLTAFTLVSAVTGSRGLLGGLLGGTVCEVTRLLENPLNLRRLVNELNEALTGLEG